MTLSLKIYHHRKMLTVAYNYIRQLITENYDNQEEDLIRTTREIEEDKVLKDTQIVKGIGILLDAESETCSISGELDFKKSQFFGTHSKIKNQDEVIFEARKRSTDTGWTITSVKPYRDSLAEKEKRRLQVFVTIVERVNHREGLIIVRGGIEREQSREIDRRLVDFRPQKGKRQFLHILTIVNTRDYLRLTLRFDGIVVLEGDYFCQRVAGFPVYAEPTKRIECTGTVTVNNGYLCVDDKIYFEDRVVERERKLRAYDKVCVTAIESQQGQFSWRALKIKLLQKGPDPRRRPQISWDDTQEEEEERNDLITGSPVENLFATKDGISINPDECVRFRDTPVNDTSLSCITIRAREGSPKPILKKVYTCGDQNVCAFSLKIPQDDKDFVHNFQNSSEFIIEVSCSPKVMGRTKDLLKFEFDSFVCVRFLEVLVLPPKDEFSDGEEPLQNSSHYERRLKDKLGERETIKKIQQSSLVKAVPGVQPFRQAFFQIRKMSFYPIPEDLLIALEYKDNNVMNSHYSYAQEPLTFKNFVDKFDLSLWFEEIAVNRQLRQYDIGVKMNRAGLQFVLPLPNYPDITSMLHCGDKIFVTVPDAEVETGEKKYEGYIKDVRDTNLFVEFDRNSKLQLRYDNEIAKVDFTVSRFRHKCNHFAVESAFKYLGESFLFPSEQHVVVNPPRIFFEEDPKDKSGKENEEEKKTILNNPFRIKNLNEPVLGTLASRWNTRAKSVREVKPHSEVDSKPNGNVLKWFDESLNEEQRNAVRRILRGQTRPLPYIIFGPPGTGKTVTVVEAIIQIFALDPNSRILVTAPSNSAADLIADKLFASGCFVPGDFIRLLGFMRAERGKYSDDMKPFVRTGEEIDLVIKHRIIVSTTSSAAKFSQVHLSDGYFTHVFIDEAGYCHEPEALLPCILVTFTRGGQVILAGDPNQLGPVITSNYATMCGLSMSFLERLMGLPIYSRDEQKFPESKYNPLLITKLLKNYRAHSILLKIPSRLFYEDELQAYANKKMYELCADERFLQAKILVKLNVPLVFRGIQGLSGRKKGLKTYSNEYEAALTVEYVRKLLHLGIEKEDMAIITPYTGQVEEIKFQYQRIGQSCEYDGPKVGSVEEFQGGERKVILYSTVRSVAEKDLKTNDFRFVLNAKRFNVSITRPMSLLIVVGNPHVLAQDKNWFKFIEYCVEIGAYSGCNLPLELDKKAQVVIQSITDSNGNSERPSKEY